MIKLCVICQIRRDLANRDIIALIIIIDVSLHLHQVDDPLKIIFLADRYLKNDRILAQSGPDLFYRTVEISTQNVHLVDECHSRYIVGISLTPYIF